LEQTVLEMNSIFSENAIAFVLFVRLFVSSRLPFYFISIQMFSKENNILVNTDIIGGGGRLLSKVPEGERLKKKLKTTDLNAEIETCT